MHLNWFDEIYTLLTKNEFNVTMYLIIDIGTGNVRVALVDITGKVVWVGRDNVVYQKDSTYADALLFEPDHLWNQILHLVTKCRGECKKVKINAVSASSQREGIVLMDKKGNSIIGFPNHDHRGRYMEGKIESKDLMYQLTGRYPSSLFSALKLVAYRDKYPEEWQHVNFFLSISDWAIYMLTGERGYEHAQASETLLYDVKEKKWSDTLFAEFQLSKKIVPPLKFSGFMAGMLKKKYVNEWESDADTPVFVGGADTQLAIKSTRPQPGDIVLVSGTTTPVVKLIPDYITDKKQRSWTNSYLDKKHYILETNCGVTGLNYQRVKDIFYPDDSYDVIETEMDNISRLSVYACLGTLLAGEGKPLINGGFVFNVPVMTGLARADFAFAALWDIGCSIKENLDSLREIDSGDSGQIWCCGGGFQSRHLREFVSSLTGRRLLFRPGYEQASVSGAALVCAESLGLGGEMNTKVEECQAERKSVHQDWFNQWKLARAGFRQKEKFDRLFL